MSRIPTEEAKLLGGDVVDLAQLDDPREPLMEWLRAKDNRLFARAFVNRVWASYFNRGIVEPTDDLSLANPPSNEALLSYLADGFIDSGYDMKWVHRTIANSDTYQRTWKPNATNELDERNFSRAVPRRIPAEVAYDAIQMATLSDERTQSYLHDLEDRAIAMPGIPRGNARYRGEYYALSVFGKSIRENNCDCERSSEASLLQTIYLRNDQDLLDQIDRQRGGWLTDVTTEAGLTVDRKPAAGPQQPKNYAATVAKYQKQIRDYRKKGGSEKAIQKVQARMREYQKKYGRAPAGKQDETQPEERKLAQEESRKIVEEAYLRTLSRFPTGEELALAQTYVNDTDDPTDGLRGLLWTLLNTKEFIVNH